MTTILDAIAAIRTRFKKRGHEAYDPDKTNFIWQHNGKKWCAFKRSPKDDIMTGDAVDKTIL